MSDFWGLVGSSSLLFALIQLMFLNNSPIQPKWQRERPKRSPEEEKRQITAAMAAVFLGYVAMRLAQ